MKKEIAKKIFIQTAQNYNRIAADFSRTRNRLPKDLLDLRKYLKKGEKVLDLGCGNGRMAPLFNPESYLGIDVSEELLKIAREQNPEYDFEVFDGEKIPLPDQSIDLIICLAVIHHLPKAYRNKLITEAKRVLKPGGKLIMTTWHLYNLPYQLWRIGYFALLKIIGLNKLDFGDIIIPYTSTDRRKNAQRYFHVYTALGFKKFIKKHGFKIEETKIVSRGKNKNIQIVASHQ